jgi:RNA polymerase sigma-70 factor (ECF subfamily)
MNATNEAWTELGARLRRFVGRRVNDDATADDITQDVMLKVQTHLDALPPEDRLPAWLLRLARNAVIDHYRAHAVRRHADVDDVDVAEDEADAETAIRELTPCLTAMIDRLPEPYREAVKLADLAGLTQQEVADRMGIGLSGAKSRVQRARQQLRDMIVDCCRIERDTRGNIIDYHTTERSSRYCGGDGDDTAPCR